MPSFVSTLPNSITLGVAVCHPNGYRFQIDGTHVYLPLNRARFSHGGSVERLHWDHDEKSIKLIEWDARSMRVLQLFHDYRCYRCWVCCWLGRVLKKVLENSHRFAYRWAVLFPLTLLLWWENLSSAVSIRRLNFSLFLLLPITVLQDRRPNKALLHPPLPKSFWSSPNVQFWSVQTLPLLLLSSHLSWSRIPLYRFRGEQRLHGYWRMPCSSHFSSK